MDTKLTQTLKVFSLFMFCILFVNMASALEFDNVKSYDPVSREVTVTNSFGLGADIGKARLNTPLNVHVGLGYQKVAEFDIWAYQDYNDALKQFTFTDLKKKEKINRDFDLKMLSYEDVVVDDYDCLEYSKNMSCLNFGVVGSHTEQREVWSKVSPADLKKNEKVTIGIFTEVQVGDYVDWIPTLYGVEIEEWASWTADLNTDIEAYFKFEETSGTDAEDSTGNNGGTILAGTTLGETGKIGDAFGFTGSAVAKGVYTDTPFGDSSMTFAFWINPQDSEGLIYSTNSGDGYSKITIGADGGGSCGAGHLCFSRFRGSWSDSQSTATTGTGSYEFWAVTISGTTIKLYKNGALDSTHTNGQSATTPTFSFIGNLGWAGIPGSAVDNAKAYLDEFGVWNRVLGLTEIQQLYNSGTGITYTDTFNDNPSIVLNDPTANANYTTPTTITFNYSVSDDIQVSDVKLYVNDVLNQTNATGINDTYYYFDLEMGDGDFGVYAIVTDNSSLTNTSAVLNFTIDSTLPTLTTALNLTDQTTWTLPINSTWNYTASDTHIDSCYYNTSDNATYTPITCNASITTEWATGGNKTVQYCANDTFGFETCNTDYVYIYYVQETQTESSDPTVEGLTETWTFTVNLTSIPTTTANIWINGTYYDPTTTTASADAYVFTFTKQIPDTWGNTTGNILDWRWNYTIDGVVMSRNTTLTNITVYELAIDDCSTYGDVILNMSLVDEELRTAVNGSAGANVEIDLNLVSKANSSITLDYSNTWTDDANPLVCIPANVLNDTEYWMDFTIGFSSTDHVWEFFYLDDGTLNSSKVFDVQTTTPLNLYDLLTADSTSFLFNYFDQDGLAVDDTIVHVYRKYIGDGQFREVERAKGDQNGDTIVHLVEEDVIYYFVISQYGIPIFTSSTYTALCQTTPCTIQVEASGGSATFPTDWDLVDGGAYTISSSPTTRQVTLDFTSTEASTFNLTVYKYESDGSYTAINTTSDTGTSGSMSLYVPQSAGNVSFFATVDQDDTFINSEWVDFTGKASDRFGITTALFIASLIILTLGLMAVSEGVGTLVFVILGVMLSGFLGLIQVELSTGVNIVIYLVLAGGILLWKLTGGRR